jgi:hypothetical protein
MAAGAKWDILLLGLCHQHSHAHVTLDELITTSMQSLNVPLGDIKEQKKNIFPGLLDLKQLVEESSQGTCRNHNGSYQ